MSSVINDIVDTFDIGFFSTDINTKNPINLDVSQASEFASFNETLKVISTEAYTPPASKYTQLDGYTFDENNNQIPTKIVLEGVYSQDSFLDEKGNWDEKAEAEAYEERELKYKKEAIDDWLKNIEYDLQYKGEIMKALLAKAEA